MVKHPRGLTYSRQERTRNPLQNRRLLGRKYVTLADDIYSIEVRFMAGGMSGKALRDYFAAEAMNALLGAIPRDDWGSANAESLRNIAQNAFDVWVVAPVLTGGVAIEQANNNQ